MSVYRNGYVVKSPYGHYDNYKKMLGKRRSHYDIFMVKDAGGRATIDIGDIHFPQTMLGKRFRIKVEPVDDGVTK